MDKPVGWGSKGSDQRYLWETIARDAVTDAEVFCLISRTNDAIVRENMSRVLKQSIAAQEFSAKQKAMDVGASVKQRKAVAAQEELYEGALPINVAVVFLVHRQSLEDLDVACRYLQNCFRRPTWVDRESYA